MAAQFIDEVTIQVVAGNGGNGCASFHREKYIPKGKPNGGDGGRGGSIYLEATSRFRTLLETCHSPQFKAKSGQHGKGSDCHGRKGEDITIHVPIGTVVSDHMTKVTIGDLTADGQRLCVAQGGRGGLGNPHFKSSRNRSPMFATKGELGEERSLRLELRLLADVGVIGLPNAGKSTLVSTVSTAKTKASDYPFTTLKPHLGHVEISAYQSFIISDLPGIIEGAHLGAGLGTRFLKHASRCGLLLHCVSIESADTEDIETVIQQLQQEIEVFSTEIAAKPRWLVLTKCDLLTPDQVQTIKAHFAPCYAICAYEPASWQSLIEDIYQHLNQ